MKSARIDSARRRFFAGAAAGAAAAAAARSLPAPKAVAEAAAPDASSRGYRVTAHIRKFYKTAGGP